MSVCHPKTTRIENRDREIIRLYRRGKSTREVAALLRVSKDYVNMRLRANGISRRAPSDANVKAQQEGRVWRLDASHLRDAIARRAAEGAAATIGDQYGR